MINNYHNIQYCDQVHSLEQILEQYEINKASILDLLKTNTSELKNLWQFYLCMDQYCHNQLCSQCELLTHIQNDYVVNQPFKIKTGEYLILTKTKVYHPYLKCVDKKIKGDFFTIKLLIT